VRDATKDDWLVPFFSGDAFPGLFSWLAENGKVETCNNGAPKVPGVPVEILWFLIVALLATWALLRTPVGNWIFAAGGDANAARSHRKSLRTLGRSGRKWPRSKALLEEPSDADT